MRLKVLIACEESQIVCEAFRKLGHSAYSCDIQECTGGHPAWHIKGDVLPLLNGFCEFRTLDGNIHKINSTWDLIIAHPPCTYLTVTGNRWFDELKYGAQAVQRKKDREFAITFFLSFVNANCEHICIENPVGVMSTKFRKPDQVINPTMFGDPFDKRSCLWLKGLLPLVPTHIVQAEPRVIFSSGKTMSSWYATTWRLPKEERAKLRSKTFPGIASAMAEQWSKYLLQEKKIKIS